MRLHGAVVPQGIKWPFTVQRVGGLIPAVKQVIAGFPIDIFFHFTVCKFQSLPKSHLHFSAERKNYKSW